MKQVLGIIHNKQRHSSPSGWTHKSYAFVRPCAERYMYQL